MQRLEMLKRPCPPHARSPTPPGNVRRLREVVQSRARPAINWRLFVWCALRISRSIACAALENLAQGLVGPARAGAGAEAAEASQHRP